MTEPAEDDVSVLPDLTGVTLETLRDMRGLDPYTERALEQVERPRANLGGGGPPGRAD